MTKQPYDRFYQVHQSTIDRLDASGVELRSQMVFIKMCFKADAKTGCYIGSADSIADKISHNEITVKVARSILAELEENGLIRRLRNESKRGDYRIAIEGYECTAAVGKEKGRRVCLDKTGVGTYAVVGYTYGEVSQTCDSDTEEEDYTEYDDPNHAATIPVVNSEPEAPAKQHRMIQFTEDVFKKLGKTSGEQQLRKLNEWLYARGNAYLAERFEDLVAYACVKEYWAKHISSVHDLVWSLNSSNGANLREQFEEKKPGELASYRKALKATLAKRAKL
jgi:hypothetical protein